jgi:hypothetical protein
VLVVRGELAAEPARGVEKGDGEEAILISLGICWFGTRCAVLLASRAELWSVGGLRVTLARRLLKTQDCAGE